MKKLVVANWKSNMPRFTPPNGSIVAAAFPFINMLPEGIIRAAQDVSRFEKGAYTGEVTAEMLKSLRVQYCLIGHSERRKYFNETLEIIREKIKRLLEQGIVPIVCAQNEEEVVEGGYIMFEPETAISTPGNFHPESPEKVAEIILDWKNKFKTKILYGGSINGENIKDYLEADGFVVGQASLEAASFLNLIKALEGLE